QNNYITIHRGENQGVKRDMGVISSSGIVGTVVNTSANYATVMSMLHRQSRMRASLKKSGETGTVQWDGNSPLFLTLIDIPKSARIAKGDSIVTSYSDRFPPGLLVGTVYEIIEDKASNFYTLKLKPGTNFFNLQYVYVIENLQRDEQKQLEEATKKIQ
ncbi:MAG TPA: rod shape-determining protein MreC, partial [Chitinophagaceae bacterium]|nr:rod shape-determining protein MreC [Chitinophagaceae bacterium]